MYDRILVPVDGSECGRQAAEYAIELASVTGASVDFVHVLDTARDSLASRVVESDRREHAEAILESTLGLAEGAGCPAETHLLEGTPETEIVASATELDADIVVMGRQGSRNLRERLLGGVTESVVHRSDRPVVVVPLAGDGSMDSVSEVLVSTDGSANAEVAREPAADFAAAFDARLSVLTVLDVTAAGGSFDAGGVTQEFLDRLESEGETIVEEFAAGVRTHAPALTVETVVRRGNPHEEITTQAAETDADLIVMGSHGRTGLTRHLLGSVTDRALRVADTPVMVVTPSDR